MDKERVRNIKTLLELAVGMIKQEKDGLPTQYDNTSEYHMLDKAIGNIKEYENRNHSIDVNLERS